MTGKQIAQAIEIKCGSDLDRIEQSGVPREVAIFFAISAAERKLDSFTPEVKEAFRRRAMDAKDAAAVLYTGRKKLRAFVGVSEVLDGQAESLREYSKNLGAYLREHGRADHDQALPIIVSSILTLKPQFDCWEALSHVIAEAYLAAGRDARSVTADKLFRAAKLIR
jgi:hypothetical protein